MARPPRLSALLAAAALSACVSRAPAKSPRPVPSAPPAPRAALSPRVLSDESLGHGSDGEQRRVRLEPHVAPEHAGVAKADDPIQIDLHLPPRAGAERRPLVLMSPILGSKNLLIGPFASAFARRGWITAVVQRKDLVFDPETALERAEPELALLVERSRQALDWLLARPDVDPQRTATCGVSAGAIVSAMVGGSDPRFAAHVWILAGGPLADVMTETTEGRFERWGVALWQRHGLSRAEVRRRLRDSIRTDPVALAAHVPRESVLLMLARHDTSVPTHTGWALYEALGRPALRLLPFGHYTSFTLLPWILQETTGFLAQRFAALPATTAPGGGP